MRHFFKGLVVATITMLGSTVAMADNQETAETIAKGLRESGGLGDAKIGVKFQDGTAWLHGQVRDEQQMASLLRATFSTPGVTRVINNMSVGSPPAATEGKWLGRPGHASKAAEESQTETTIQLVSGAMEPERFTRPVPERTCMPQTAQAPRRVELADATDQPMGQPTIAPQLADPTPAKPQIAQRVAESVEERPNSIQPVAAHVPTVSEHRPIAKLQQSPRKTPVLAQHAPRTNNRSVPVAYKQQMPAARPQEMMPVAYPQQMMPVARPQQMMPVARPQEMPVAYQQEVVMEGPPSVVPGPMPASGAVPRPMYGAPVASGPAPYRYDQPTLPNYAWPSYAAHPNYAALTYPRQYSPTAWPYIGPFYPYPQVPLGWRKVTLEWDDGWWWLDFKNTPSCHRSPVGRHY